MIFFFEVVRRIKEFSKLILSVDEVNRIFGTEVKENDEEGVVNEIFLEKEDEGD